MAGFLVSPSFHQRPISKSTLEVVAIILGFLLAVAVFAAGKAARQTYMSWHRLGGKLKAYIVMIWVCWSCCITQGATNYAYFTGSIPPSFWFFLAEILIWMVQVQCLTQIMANRISLVMYSYTDSKRLRISVFVIILILTGTTAVVWIPTQLQRGHGWSVANAVWNRVEKSIYLIVDAFLNLLFIYLVQSKLIQQGLTKYRPLFWFNIAMVTLSISLDITIIGIVSLPRIEIYVQFRSLIYIIKLHIEMTIAEFIARIVKTRDLDGRLSKSWSYPMGGSVAPSGPAPNAHRATSTLPESGSPSPFRSSP